MAEGSPGPMAGTATLVTGGTGGIGRATAPGLAAAAAIARESGNPSVEAFAADMSSQAEVRRLAAVVLDAYPRLDVLVNNVGGFWASRRQRAYSQFKLANVMFTYELARRLDGTGVTANRRPKTSSKASYDTTAAARLWDTSARLTHSGGEAQRLAVLRSGRVRRGAD